MYCSGGESRKQEHPSFLRAAPNGNNEGAKVFHPAVTEGWLKIAKPFFRLVGHHGVYDYGVTFSRRNSLVADGSKDGADLQNDVFMAHLGTYIVKAQVMVTLMQMCQH